MASCTVTIITCRIFMSLDFDHSHASTVSVSWWRGVTVTVPKRKTDMVKIGCDVSLKDHMEESTLAFVSGSQETVSVRRRLRSAGLLNALCGRRTC